MLTGPAIAEAIRLGDIEISPYDSEMIGPESIDLHLGSTLCVYDAIRLDCKRQHKLHDIQWDNDDGYELLPGELYLGHTLETIGSDLYHVDLHGKSGLARLGVTIDVTGAFGSHDFKGCWTLELTCVKPVRIYRGMQFCQASFIRLEGKRKSYVGSYANSSRPLPSMLWKQFVRDSDE